MIPEKDRLYVWMLVKNLDLPRHLTVRLLDDLGVQLHNWPSDPYVRRSDFRNLLYNAAES